jgi:hypothetical protein
MAVALRARLHARHDRDDDRVRGEADRQHYQREEGIEDLRSANDYANGAILDTMRSNRWGRRKRGKEQLRVSEARTFIDTCRQLGERRDAGAIAAMTALLLGLRASEVTDRVVRGLDDDGQLL